MKSKWLFVVFCLFAANLQAQSFKWQAKLDTVTADGFYKIAIPTGITSKTKPAFTDLRILDSKNKAVPYLVEQEKPATYAMLFKEYPIVYIHKTQKHTTVLLSNTDKKKINNIQLQIKNAEVTKTLRLSGSEDTLQWYIIKDNYAMSDVYSNSNTSSMWMFDFPLSDYRYFKIDISDSASPPINIVKAGYYDSYSEDAKYNAIPESHIVFTQRDSAETKETYIKITLTDSDAINKLSFTFDGPKYYQRSSFLGDIHESKERNGSLSRSFSPVSDGFILASGKDNTIYVDMPRRKTMYLVIRNLDNQPLKIISVKAYQLANSLITYLQKGQGYRLAFGNDSLNTAPSYDLVNFKDSITSTKPLAIGSIITKETPTSVTSEKPKSIFDNKALIWIPLIMVLVILAFMSFRIIKEMGNK